MNSLAILANIIELEQSRVLARQSGTDASDLFRLFAVTSRICPDTALYFLLKGMVDDGELEIEEAIAAAAEIHRLIKSGEIILTAQHRADFAKFFKG